MSRGRESGWSRDQGVDDVDKGHVEGRLLPFFLSCSVRVLGLSLILRAGTPSFRAVRR